MMSWTNVIFSDRIRSIGGKLSMNFSIFPGNVEKMDLFLDLKACPKQVENEDSLKWNVK